MQAFKKAIQEADWNTICTIYTCFTGEPILPSNIINTQDNVLVSTQDNTLQPKKTPVSPQVDKDGYIIDEESNFSVQEDGEQPGINIEDKVKYTDHTAPSKKDNAIVQKKQKMLIPEPGKRPNRFQDKQKSVIPPSTHTRKSVEDRQQTSTQVDVVCSLCKESGKISETLAQGYSKDPDDNTYKCNECNTPAGRRNYLKKQEQQEE